MRLSTVIMRTLAGFPKLAGRAKFYGMRIGITLIVDAADHIHDLAERYRGSELPHTLADGDRLFAHRIRQRSRPPDR